MCKMPSKAHILFQTLCFEQIFHKPVSWNIHHGIYLHVYICIHVYICKYICIHVNMNLWIYVYMYSCIHVYMYIRIHVYMNICIYLYMHICMYRNTDQIPKFRKKHVYMYVCTHVYMHICIYVNMYIRTYIHIYKNMYRYTNKDMKSNMKYNIISQPLTAWLTPHFLSIRWTRHSLFSSCDTSGSWSKSESHACWISCALIKAAVVATRNWLWECDTLKLKGANETTRAVEEHKKGNVTFEWRVVVFVPQLQRGCLVEEVQYGTALQLVDCAI